MTLLTISVDRYKAICSSINDDHCFTRRYPIRTVILIWLCACIMALPFVFMTHLESAIFYDGSTVDVCNTVVRETWHHVFIGSMFAICFVIPLFALLVLYILITKKIQATAKSEGNRNLKQRKQAFIMIMIVVAVFFISLMPMRLFMLWLIYSPIEDKQNLGFIPYVNLMNMCRILMYVNSAINPLIYALVSKRFRASFRKALQMCVCSINCGKQSYWLYQGTQHRTTRTRHQFKAPNRVQMLKVYRFNTKQTTSAQIDAGIQI